MATIFYLFGVLITITVVLAVVAIAEAAVVVSVQSERERLRAENDLLRPMAQIAMSPSSSCISPTMTIPPSLPMKAKLPPVIEARRLSWRGSP